MSSTVRSPAQSASVRQATPLACRFSRSTWYAALGILCFDCFCDPPLFSVGIGQMDAVALVVFSATALVVTHLMSRLRKPFQKSQALPGEICLVIDTIRQC